MKRTATLFSAFALTCAAAAFPAAANASDGGTKHRTHVHHVRTIPASAAPLSPSVLAPATSRDDDSDGLTRNTDECNRGCIDN